MEIFRELLPYINIEDYITPVLGGFGITIGTVYLFGRMLNIIKSPYKKNLLAVVVATSWTITCELELLNTQILSIITTVSWLLVVYVLIGFNLYPWFTYFIENKIAKRKTSDPRSLKIKELPELPKRKTIQRKSKITKK